MQSAVIDIQRDKAVLDPYGAYGAAGSLAQPSSMELGSLDRAFMDRLGSAPLDQELDIGFTLGAAPAANAQREMPSIPPLLPQQAAPALPPPWPAAGGGGLGLPPPGPQPWDSGDAMETVFRLPEPVWDSNSALSASVSGPGGAALGRPLSPEGSSQDGGDAVQLGNTGSGSPPHTGAGAPSDATALAQPRGRPGGASAQPAAKQVGGLSNAMARELVAKLAAGSAPQKPQKQRGTRAQKAANRRKPKVRGAGSGAKDLSCQLCYGEKSLRNVLL